MASRLILTLLALFAGLAAQAGPAQAHGRGAESAQILAPCAAAGALAEIALPGWMAGAASGRLARAGAALDCGGGQPGPLVPGVRLRVDRARE